MKNHFFRFSVAVMMAFSFWGDVVAQNDKASPGEIARSFQAAVQSKDWERCASLVHSDSLSAFRSRVTVAVSSILSLRFNEVKKKLFEEYDTPDNRNAFAPYDQTFAPVLSSLKVSTQKEFDELSNRVVFGRLYQQILESDLIRFALVRNTTFQLIGIVQESDDLTHLVYRSQVRLPIDVGKETKVIVEQKAGGKVISFCTSGEIIGMCRNAQIPDEGQIEVVTLKKDGADWRVLLDADALSLIGWWETGINESKEGFESIFGVILSRSSEDSRARRPPPPPKPVRRSRKK